MTNTILGVPYDNYSRIYTDRSPILIKPPTLCLKFCDFECCKETQNTLQCARRSAVQAERMCIQKKVRSATLQFP